MPDENANPVWTTQTSQDDKVVTAQSWGDFVLDFWDMEDNAQITVPEAGLDNLSWNTGESEEEMVKTDIDLDSEDLFGNDKETEEANSELDGWELFGETEEKKEEEVVAMEDSDLKLEDNVNVSENILDGILDEAIEENDGDVEKQDNIVSELNFEDDLSFGNWNNWDMDEVNFDLETEGDVKWGSENVKEMEIVESKEENSGRTSEEALLSDVGDNQSNLEEVDDVNSLEWDNQVNQESGDSMTEIKINDEEWGLKTDFDLDIKKSEEDIEIKTEDESDNSVKDLERTEDSWVVTDSELWNGVHEDDLWMSFDLQFDWSSDGLTTEKVQDDITGRDENVEFQEISWDNNVEDNEGQMKYDENLSGWIDTYEWDSNAMDNHVQESEEGEGDQSEWFEMKSTLSLDEIMDSELQSGKFADNDKKFLEEAKDETENKKDGMGKRIFVVAAWVWVFLMMWVAAYLAFPDLLSNNSNEQVSQDEEQVDQHFIADSGSENPLEQDLPWIGEIVEDDQQGVVQVEEYQLEQEWTIGGTSKVGVEVVDPFVEDDSSGEESFDIKPDDLWGGTFPTPYVWEDTSDFSEEYVAQEDSITFEEINNKIASFKEKWESYYIIAQETSDTHIYKYAMKMLSLCDNYEKRIANGEWIDQESYDSFNKSINWVLLKIEEYNWTSNIKNINVWNDSSINNSDDSSDERTEEENEKYRKYVTDRADSQ